MNRLIRTVIAASDETFVTELSDSLHKIEDLQVVGIASDGPGVIQVCRDTLPDVVILSLHLPVVDGVKATQAIVQQNAQTAVLIIADLNDQDYALQAIKMGAKGYLWRESMVTYLAQAINHINQGQFFLLAQQQ